MSHALETVELRSEQKVSGQVDDPHHPKDPTAHISRMPLTNPCVSVTSRS